MQRAVLLTLLALAPCCHSLVLRATQELRHEESTELQFWLSEWADIEGDLMHLKDLAEQMVQSKPDGKKPATTKEEKDPKAELEKIMATAVGGSAKGAMQSAMLLPALEMLKGMYDSGKERIAQLNVREQKLKKQFETREKDHKHKLEQIEAKSHSGLSVELLKNETSLENRMFSYWQGVRERQHRQYHNSLKIQHSMMARTKTMIDMYEKTINGKASDKAKIKQELQKVSGGMPEVVFIQQTSDLVQVGQDVVNFCHDALAEARASVVDLENTWHTKSAY